MLYYFYCLMVVQIPKQRRTIDEQGVRDEHLRDSGVCHRRVAWASLIKARPLFYILNSMTPLFSINRKPTSHV